MTKEKINPLDQWLALNKILHFYKGMGVILALICVLLTALSFYLATTPPVVVIQDGEKKKFYSSKRKKC